MANKTDIGHTRTKNEDRALIRNDLNGFTLAIVADGMGGHQAGDIASQLAIEIIQDQLQMIHIDLPVEERKLIVRQAIYMANDSIYQLASTKLQYQGMGTTVVLAIATEEWLLIANIGDSRAYKASEKSIIQLTEDHSLVSELVKNGQITAEEASFHPRRNVLTRALGTEQNVTIDIYDYVWSDKDFLLLCTDGLSGFVDNQQILQILNQNEDIYFKADKLVESALEAGGEDNITVVLLSNEKEHDKEAR